MAFASARLMALRRLVAGRALDFDEELCSICICICMYLYKRYVGDPNICICYIAPVKIQFASQSCCSCFRLHILVIFFGNGVGVLGIIVCM